MHRFVRNLTILLLFLATIMAAGTASAQTKFGIDWQPSKSGSLNPRLLKELKKAGFSYLIVHDRLNSSIMDEFQKDSIGIYVQFPYSYLTDNEITGNYVSIQKKDLDLIAYYDHYPIVKGYILFREGQLLDHDFSDWLQVLIGDVTKNTDKPILFISSYRLKALPHGAASYIYRTQLPDKISPDTITTSKLRYYDPSVINRFSLRKLNEYLTRNQASANLPIFFPYTWYHSVSKKQPALTDMIHTYSVNAHAVFPTSSPSAIPPPINWIVLILLVVWAVFAIHFNFEPNYRKSVIRYFGYHSFFISDISERLDRLTVSNLIVFGLITLSGGLYFYAISLYFLTGDGLKALVEHVAILHIFGHSWIIYFIIGALATFTYNLICYVILIIFSFNFSNISQIMTIYLWPQQINLIVVSIMVPVVLSGAPVIFVTILSVIFFLVMTASYYMAATDCARLAKYPTLFRYETMAIHAITLIVVISWLITYSGLPDALSLAVSLP